MVPTRWWLIGTTMLVALAGCGIAGGSETTAATSTSTPLPASTNGVYNILDFGAVGDGTTMNTAAIQKTIDTCSRNGGGKVLVPAGTFKTGPITLVSSLDLHLAPGALIQFSDNRDDFPMMISNFEGKPTVICRSPISGENLDHLSITGEGTFDGAGQVWRPEAKVRMSDTDWDTLVASGGYVQSTPARDQGEIVPGAPSEKVWYPSKAAADGAKKFAKLRGERTPPNIADYKDLRDLLRPPLVMLSNCSHLMLEGCTFRNSPVWTIHLLACNNVAIKNITSWNPIYGRNNDGIDIDSCNDVTITGSTVYSGDDNICIKSGLAVEGQKRPVPSENIKIDNCNIGWGHGGVAIGSELSGGVRNVTVSNCIMRGPEVGLRFKSARGRGGLVENIIFTNITMYDIKQAAIGFSTSYHLRSDAPQPVDEDTPIFRQISFYNITCQGTTKQALDIHGLTEMPISNVILDHCNLTAEIGAVIENARNLVLHDVEIHTKASPPITVQNVDGLTTDQLTATAEMPLAPAPTTRPSEKTHSHKSTTRRFTPLNESTPD